MAQRTIWRRLARWGGFVGGAVGAVVAVVQAYDRLAALWAGIDPLIKLSAALKLFWAVVGIAVIFLALKVYDALEGVDFRQEFWVNAKNDPDARAIGQYRGMVVVGLCLLVGLLFSR